MEEKMTETKLDLLQGTLDLLVLQTLVSMGSLPGESNRSAGTRCC
jgi:hypothetical protein